MFNAPLNRWWTVAAGALGCAAGAGVVASYVFGLFVKAIAAEYQWGRSETTASITCFYIASGLGSLALGSIIARFNVRAPTILFVIAFALSVMGVALLPRSVPLFCIVFAVMGFFGSAATAMPYAIAISGWFDRNRGLALALAVGGTGLSATFMSRYANWLMANYGWRGGYAGVGLLVGVVALFGLVFFFRNPSVSIDRGPDANMSLWTIYTGDRLFWIIALPIFMISMALLGLITNLAPILTDRGMSLSDAAALLGLLGGASWISRLGVGVLLDRVHVRYIAAVIFTMIAVGAFIIASGVGGISLAIGAVLIGLGMGSEADLVSYSVSRYFAGHTLGRALGAVWIFWAWGSGIGVLIGSLSYDLTGSYHAALIVYGALALLSAVTVLRLGHYRYGSVVPEGGMTHSVQHPSQSSSS